MNNTFYNTPSKSLNYPSIISWKGKTFNQIVSAIRKNTNSNTETALFFAAQPQQHYRREIATTSIDDISEYRRSMTIGSFERPGGGIITSVDTSCVGINTTIDFHLTENFSERPCLVLYDDIAQNVNSAELNARRRVRSGGMIKSSVRPGTVNDKYKTTNSEYLQSRGLTYQQNQFHNYKEGNKNVVAGENNSYDNIYVNSNMSNCPKLLISAAMNNNSFSYGWLDEAEYTVTIDDDYYDIGGLLTKFKAVMYSNGHYLVNNTDGSILYLFDMYYDTTNSRLVWIAKATDTTIHSNYSVPEDETAWSIPTVTTVPQFIISVENNFYKVVGISTGSYPTTDVGSQASTYSSDQYFYGTAPEIRPAYKPVYYKPNNSQYSQQGGVASSERIARLKYNTITTAGASFRSAYGNETSNAYAYNVSMYGSSGMTMKDKIGFQNIKTPNIPKYDGAEQNCCDPAYNNKIKMRW